MGVGVQQQLIWAQRELRGERALRRGWEAECRRSLEQNRELRAKLAALKTPERLEDAA